MNSLKFFYVVITPYQIVAQCWSYRSQFPLSCNNTRNLVTSAWTYAHCLLTTVYIMIYLTDEHTNKYEKYHFHSNRKRNIIEMSNG